MQYVDLHTWLPGDILTKADRMSMAHSLELRVPFLDRAVYAAAAALPTSLKLARTTKFALREAMRGIVPDAVVDRRKLGFPTPTRVWLRGDIGVWAGDVFADAGVDHLLDLGHAQRLLAAHRRGDADHSRKIWTVLMFCLWYAQQNTPRPPPARRTSPRGYVARSTHHLIFKRGVDRATSMGQKPHCRALTNVFAAASGRAGRADRAGGRAVSWSRGRWRRRVPVAVVIGSSLSW